MYFPPFFFLYPLYPALLATIIYPSRRSTDDIRGTYKAVILVTCTYLVQLRARSRTAVVHAYIILLHSWIVNEHRTERLRNRRYRTRFKITRDEISADKTHAALSNRRLPRRRFESTWTTLIKHRL